MWDFTKVKFLVKDVMRYDTPGDFKDDIIEAWSGLVRPEYIQGVQIHEFNEAIILRAMGITDEQIDTIDDYRLKTRRYAKGKATLEELGTAAIEFAKILPQVVDKYDQAHFVATLHERAFIEACGLNWKEYDDFIEATRGKIPHGRPE